METAKMREKAAKMLEKAKELEAKAKALEKEKEKKSKEAEKAKFEKAALPLGKLMIDFVKNDFQGCTIESIKAACVSILNNGADQKKERKPRKEKIEAGAAVEPVVEPVAETEAEMDQE